MYVFVCPYEYVYVCDMCPVQEKWEICTSTQFFHFLSHVCVCVLSFDGLYLSLGMYIPTYDVPNLKRVVILTGVCVCGAHYGFVPISVCLLYRSLVEMFYVGSSANNLRNLAN